MSYEIIPAGAQVPAHVGTTANPMDHPVVVYILSLQSEQSRATMRRQLNAVAALYGVERMTLPRNGREEDWRCLLYDWTSIMPHTLEVLKAELAVLHSVATTNLMLSAVKGVLGKAFIMGKIDAEHYQRARLVKGLKETKVSQAAGRVLSQREIDRLIAVAAADENTTGARDAALLALACELGARRAELAGMNVDDVRPSPRPSQLLIVLRGKGNKERTIYIERTGGAGRALVDWLAERGEKPGPLFTRLHLGVQNGDPSGRLTTQSIYEIMQRRAKQAGVDSFSPHDLRRTMISEHLRAGTDISTLAGLVGHASTDTTRIYDRRGEDAKQDVAGQIHTNYPGRRKRGG